MGHKMLHSAGNAIGEIILSIVAQLEEFVS